MKSIYITIIVSLFTVFVRAADVKNNQLEGKPVSFEIILDTAIKDKAVIVVYQNSLYKGDYEIADRQEIEATSHHGNVYIFDLGMQQKPMYFAVFLKNSSPVNARLLSQIFFEPGDHIKFYIKPLHYQKFDVHAEGTGAAKFNCQNAFKKPSKDPALGVYDFNSDNTYNTNSGRLKWMEKNLSIIENYKPEMSEYAYQLLKTDVIGEFGYDLQELFIIRMRDALAKKDTSGFRRLRNDYETKFKFNYTNNIPDDILIESNQYTHYMLKKTNVNSLIIAEKRDFKVWYNLIKKTSDQTLRDKMILTFFINNLAMNEGYDELLADALITVKNKAYLAKLQEFNHGQIENKAYNFTLTDVKGNKVTLADFKDKIVFIDFWFTGCGACESYYQYTLKEVEHIYKDNPDMVFMTICVDNDKEKWLKSVRSGIYTSEEVVNLYTNGEGSQHPLIKYYNIIGFPHPMIIGRKGEIIRFTGYELRYKDKLTAALDEALKSPSK